MRRFTLLLLCVFAVGGLAAQQSDSVSFRVQSKLVIVDLLVTDKSGNLVADLRPDEVEVFENGDKQKIESFLLARRDLYEQDAAAGLTVNPNATEFSSPASAAYFVMAIDLATVSQNEVELVRQSMYEFLRREPSSEARFMIATVGTRLAVLQPFTSDVGAIEHAIEDLRNTTLPSEVLLSPVQSQIGMIMSGTATLPSLGLATGVGAAKIYIDRLDNQVRRTSRHLEMLGRAVRSLPGRKHLVFYSAGYHLDAPAQLKSMVLEMMASLPPAERPLVAAQLDSSSLNLNRHLPAMIDQLNRSQVSVYSVDPRGLITGGATRFSAADIAGPRSYLTYVSGETAGEAFYSNNDLQRGIRQAFRDAEQFYLLAYRPPGGGKKNRLRRIDVKVHRPDVEVRHRGGYLPLSDRDAVQSDIFNAAAFPGLFPQPDLEVTVEQSRSRLLIDVDVPLTALRFQHSGELWTCPVEVYGVLIDAEGNMLGGTVAFARRDELELTEEQINSPETLGVASDRYLLGPPPGTYQLVVIVRQGITSELWADSRKITVGLGGS